MYFRKEKEKMTYLEYFKNGEEFYTDGKYSEALSYFQESLNLKETNDCLNYIGCCYLKIGNFDYAINTFKKIITICSDWERPIFNLGRAYLQLHNYEEALKCFERAKLISPENEDVYFYVGLYYYEIDDYEKSISINDLQPKTQS